MRFRMRHNKTEKGSNASPAPASANGPAPAPVATTGKTASLPAPPALHGLVSHPLKSQVSGADVRMDRLARQIRTEMTELRKQVECTALATVEVVDLDVAALVANPVAASQLPAAQLVRALGKAHARATELARGASRQRRTIRRLRAEVQEMEQERAFLRGRMHTFDDIIAALHANIEDLRLHRDSSPVVAPALQPLALRPSAQATVEARLEADRA